MKKGPFFYILGFLITLTAFPAGAAQDPSSLLRAHLDKQEAGIAEPVRFVISSRIARDAAVTVPETIPDLKNLQVKDHGLKVSRGLMGPSSFKAWFVLVGYEPGTYEIPPFDVTVRSKGTNIAQTLKTPKMTLLLKSLVSGDVQKLDIKDIKGTYVPFPWKMLLSGCFLALSLIGWYVYVRITTAPLSKASEPPAPPAHQIALERIEKLLQKDLIGRGLVEEFTVELSLIVRQYLEARFAIRAPEMTTEEFLAFLKDSETLTSRHKDLLKRFLSHCDLVKFARYNPVSDETYGALDAAKNLIMETKTP